MDPKKLAAKIWGEMTHAEIARVGKYGVDDLAAGDRMALGNDDAMISVCINEVERLCGFVPDEGA